MKKFFTILLFAVVCVFTSCVRAEKPEWISNLDEAKKSASANDKFILLSFTSSDIDIEKKYAEIGFGTEEFLKKHAKDFVFVKYDFADRLKAESLNPDATEEEKSNAQKIIENTDDAIDIAALYAVQNLPTVYLLTKEGYVVPASVEYPFFMFFDMNPEFNPNGEHAAEAKMEDVFIFDDAEKIEKRIEDALVLANDFKNNVKIAYEEKDVEKVSAAINEIFDSTDPNFRYILRDLSKKLVETDTENKSGSVAKHEIALIAAEAIDAGMDFKKVAEIFANGAENGKFLTGDDKQLLYYQATQATLRIGPSEKEMSKIYIKKSIESNPESEQVPLLQGMLDYIEKQ